MRVSRVDQILQARGINGIILAPPCNSSLLLHLNLERYAAVGTGFGWGTQKLNLVGYDNLQNYITAFQTFTQNNFSARNAFQNAAFIIAFAQIQLDGE